jgi:O-antigen/teichoic acid export membrane protein
MVVASPLLTRLYEPEDFGFLSIYLAFLALFSVVSSLRYQLAIPLPENDEDSVHITVLSLLCVLLVTVACASFCFFLGARILSFLNASLLMGYIWLLPLGVFLTGLYQVFNYWALREHNYVSISATRVRQALSAVIIQLLGFKLGVFALMFGHAVGQGVGSYSLAKSAILNSGFKKIQKKRVWEMAKRYKQFPYYSTWDALLNTAGTQLPPLMFASLFNPGAAGLYALAHRVFAVPMSVVGDAVAKVFISKAAEASRQGVLGEMVLSVHQKLAAFAMPPMLIIFIAGPDLFRIVFGQQWTQAGEFARWMAPWLYLVFVTSPLSSLFAVLEKQRHGLLFQVALITLRLFAVFAGSYYGDLGIAVMLFALVSALCWLGLLLWIGASTSNNVIAMLLPSIKAGLISIGLVTPLWLGVGFHVSKEWWMLSLILSVCFVLFFYKKTLLGKI